MMIDPHYPRLDEASVFGVEVLLKLLDENPKHLNDPSCPYTEDIRQLLLRLHTSRQSAFEIKDLQDEAENLFSQLKKLGESIATTEVKERVAYMRVATSLFDKLITLKERSAGIKAASDFKKTMLDVIDSVMTPEQRTVLMDRLNAL